MRKKLGFVCTLAFCFLITASAAFAGESEKILPKIAFSKNSNEIILFGDGSEAPVTNALTSSVIEVNGSVYVPIRPFSVALGYGVTYDPVSMAVTVTNDATPVTFANIKVSDDLQKELVYFSLNGNSYAKAEDFAKVGHFKVSNNQDVFLFYQEIPSTDPASLENAEPPADAELSDDTENTELTEPPTETEPVFEDELLVPEIPLTVLEIWDRIFLVMENQVTLSDGFVSYLKSNAIVPTEDYLKTIKNTYDLLYYKPFVNPYVPYAYPQMVADIKKLQEQYPEYIKVGSAGKSVEGRDLMTMELGTGSKHIFVTGSHHAREYLSTSYIMKFVNQTTYAAKTGKNTTGYDVNKLLKDVTYHIIPMVNPDGVNLVQNGIESVSPQYREQVRAMPFVEGGKYGYKSWKSNIRGVDINRNYPLGWEKLKNNVKKPASSSYPGPYPFSEPETQGVMNYMKASQPEIVISVHTQGQVLYWSSPAGTLGNIGEKMIKSSGFQPIVEDHRNPEGGYSSNYSVGTYNIPEGTIELCKYIGPYPYPDNRFDAVWAPAKDLLYIVGDEIAKKP